MAHFTQSEEACGEACAPFAFRGTVRDERTVMAQMAGRSPGFRMNPEHRVKIQNSNVLNALIEHVQGERDMSATQVSAGIALLKKVLPDLTHNQHEGTGENCEIIFRTVYETK